MNDKNKKYFSTSDKELAIVNMTTDAHINALVGFPFDWNCPIKKYIAPQSHPFVYMDIVGTNIDAVKLELSKVNSIISMDVKKHHGWPDLLIPIDDLIFVESPHHGFTRFFFTPVTLTGKPAKHPMSLFFTTDTSDHENTTHGEFTYDKTGKISKGHVYFWIKGEGYFLYYKTIDGVLTLYDTNHISIHVNVQ